MKSKFVGAGGMAQRLRAVTALPEDSPGFNSQHPHGSSQLSVTPVPEDLTPSDRHIGRQNNANAHEINISLKRKASVMVSSGNSCSDGDK